jgi:dUTPase
MEENKNNEEEAGEMNIEINAEEEDEEELTAIFGDTWLKDGESAWSKVKEGAESAWSKVKEGEGAESAWSKEGNKENCPPPALHYRLSGGALKPRRSTTNDPTYDLFCPRKTRVYPRSTHTIPLGIQFIDLLRPSWIDILTRPGLSTVHSIDVIGGSMVLPNSHKFIAVSVRNNSDKMYTFMPGERVAKLKINPNPWCRLVEDNWPG